MNKILLIILGLIPSLTFASSDVVNLDLTSHWSGYLAVTLFVIAYAFVMLEEFTHFRKSKPVILVAGLIWGIIGSVVFLIACIVFLVPYFRKNKE